MIKLKINPRAIPWNLAKMGINPNEPEPGFLDNIIGSNVSFYHHSQLYIKFSFLHQDLKSCSFCFCNILLSWMLTYIPTSSYHQLDWFCIYNTKNSLHAPHIVTSNYILHWKPSWILLQVVLPTIFIRILVQLLQRNVYIHIFVAALFIMVKIWRLPGCPSMNEWTKRQYNFYTPLNFQKEKLIKQSHLKLCQKL